ncbi:NADP-dependent aldehyde dehydrogenase [Granulicella pectinivorans]|uniref:2,5-dioxovalerate dehydrogenase n=1 Tax=Granulicella pectinivorans TaxID=474950 RepID=A0A1I6LP23_9BACT|nr:aldehyde dehydrogenase (NADP(+)) [Granulicella pectinivorans]SFS05002.1 NADP-dependent aldehyde dehydrogenase [Granulicella pectinivorans]
MPITGEMLIGLTTVRGTDTPTQAINPATGETLGPDFPGGTPLDVDQACILAAAAFDPYRAAPLEARALFLETIAANIEALGEELILRVMAESGLPRPRLEGERGRTCGQLRLFAQVIRTGSFLNLTLDSALPDRKPLARPDLRSRKIPVGPVAVFGASNFPLAFSVAGGDTASALAAGCPVVAKAHPSHLGTSELIGRAIQQAVRDCKMPPGTFSLLFSTGNAVGEALVKHPAIQAVGFTGSRRGGLALVALAQARPQPIPVYAEMSATNPVFILPAALASRGAAIAESLVASATMGVGQFCTKPGIVLGLAGSSFETLSTTAAVTFSAATPGTMLNAGIHAAYEKGTAAFGAIPSVELLAQGLPSNGPSSAQPALFRTTSQAFLATPELSEEVFGPTTLLIACTTEAEFKVIAESLEGQLTATVHMDDADLPLAQSLLPILERKAGRILINGFPTGVEVSYAMVHGGPYPATSDPRATSVGAMSIDRFLRPVCYQNFPTALLPAELQAPTLPHSLDGKPA